jgi:hypothetical protein
MAFCCHCRLSGATTITNSDAAQLAGAVQEGGTITLAFDGVVKLTAPLIIVTNTTLGGQGHTVSLDGNNLVRHFVVTNNSTLGLINLTLMNGRFAGAQGQTNQKGYPGMGGSIFISGGAVDFSGCRFINNQAIGGEGGLFQFLGAVYGRGGGPGLGGAVYATNGRVRASGCVFAGNSSAGGSGASGNIFGRPGNRWWT